MAYTPRILLFYTLVPQVFTNFYGVLPKESTLPYADTYQG